MLLAAVALLERLGDPAWRALARGAAASHPDDLDLQHAAGRAELETLLEAPGFLAGEPPPASFDTDRLGGAAAMLRKVWDALRESEVKITDASLPFNLAQTYRLLDRLDQAAAVLDQARALLPAAPELCRLRASIHALQGEEPKALGVLAIVPDDAEARLIVPMGFLIAAVLVARHLWRGVGDSAIGSGGLLILVIGGTLTIALGVGLIALIILGDRRGYDKVEAEEAPLSASRSEKDQSSAG